METVTGLISRRWLVATLLPVLGLASAFGLVVLCGTGWAESWRHWRGLSPEAKTGLLCAAIVLVLAGSQLTAAVRPGFIRLLEGYWDGLPGGGWLGRRGASRQRNMRNQNPVRFRDYPVVDAFVMPTTFGNVLRGAEVHPRGRYRIDGVTAWPRLYPVLPEAFQQAFASANAGLEQAVALCGLGAVFTLAGSALAVFLLPLPWPLVCLAAGVAVMGLGYRAAVSAATVYGQLFRAAFDVHRRTLLETMGLHPATSFAAERRQWEALDQLWAEGTVDTDRASALGYTPIVAGNPGASPAPAPAPVPPPNANAAPLHPGIVLVALFLVVAVAVTAVGLLSPPRDPVRAGRSLAAYHQIVVDDLVGDGRAAFAGRYLLRPVDRNARIASVDLGPALPPHELAGRWVLVLPDPDGTLAAAVDRGARTTALLEPRGNAPSRAFTDVLVLNVLGGAVVLAVGGADPATTVAALARGGGVLLITPVS
ncbi:hypothetical protein [Frankia sp. AgB32]|uniref:hypothetical protein n=1 Tax=Frankia sp. AgB32 TaxID=631119 RepID=UPI0020107DD1|nr:hypothetical protein [Frankia sp. AgB32]MCK9893601.1 hypothetical protein [Frankia sp. AgB32]